MMPIYRRLIFLAAYYNFEARFCNPNSGNEKGGVEGLVCFARRNYMVPIPEAESLDELNDKVLQQCVSYGSHKIAGREHTVETLYRAEREHLLSLPNHYLELIQQRPMSFNSARLLSGPTNNKIPSKTI